MLKPLPKWTEQRRLIQYSTSADGNNGAFAFRRNGVDIRVIISDGEGWEHVSVSTPARVPTWEEMCWVKDLFFDPEECVIQFHPPKSQYVNYHPYCLHLWKPDVVVPMPPSWMVGPKENESISEALASRSNSS